MQALSQVKANQDYVEKLGREPKFLVDLQHDLAGLMDQAAALETGAPSDV